MNYLKNSLLLINSLLFLFFNLCILNKVTSQAESFANPPQIDFSFTKTQYVKDKHKNGDYTLEVRMKDGKPEYQVSEKIYSSLDFIDEFHLNFVADFRKSNNKIISVDLKVDSNVTAEVLNIIELKFQYLNQLRMNYLNRNGDRIYYTIPPKFPKSECFGLCCPNDNGFQLKQKVEIKKDIYETVTSSYSTESECFESAVKEIGLFISIMKNKIFIEDKEVSLLQMNKLLSLKWNASTIKSRFIVVLKSDRSSTYDTYLKTLSELVKFYFDIRNNISLERHNLPFNKTSRQEQKKIRNETPMVIKKIYD